MAARPERTVRAGVGGPTRVLRHHPDEVDKYSIDWTDVLDTGESISSATWEAATGLTLTTLGGEAISGAITTVALGPGTVDANVLVQCQIVPQSGVIVKAGFTVQVREPMV